VENDAYTSGSLLRQARKRAHLSQTEVASRAHVAQSVISAYESDQREPALSTLTKLVEATGHRLVLSLEPDPTSRLGIPDTPLGRKLRRHRSAVLETARRHGATNVRLFGSVARSQETRGSDIDFLVDLAPETGLVSLAALERELTELLHAKVDVVPAHNLRPSVKAEADADWIPL
jgi:predicted nucleotidyltransferase/DNA-binding XRE family transcriptional regulator